MAYIHKITDTAGNTAPIASALYGTCDTAAGTAAKVVTCADFDNLQTGVTIKVKFTNANSVASPTLNVNSTGPKNIYRYGTTAPSTKAATSWNAGAIVSFTYDGSAWIMNDWLNSDTTYSNATTAKAGLMSAADKIKLDGVAEGAEVNQNAFSNVVVGSTTVSADSKTDTLTIVGSGSVTVTPDATNDKITISATDTTYSNVSTTSAGLAPTVTDTSKFLKGDGTWATPTNTTYSNVSTKSAGLAPKVTDTSKFLKGDGTWATPTNTTYSNVSSASAGLAPKGAAVSSQSQSTKFLREDGSWAAPSYTTNTNTTYAFSGGTNKFTVTPSGGTAQDVTITPSITNNVTGSGTSGYIAKFNGANTITNGPAIGSDTTKYLRNDGTWVKPPNDNTWTAMVGATSAANGSVGYVNAVPPKDGYNTKYLRADGTWTVPPDNNTTYSNVSTSAAGLAPKVTSTSKFLKGDGTWATPTNTTYSNATTAANGLMPATDKLKSDEMAMVTFGTCDTAAATAAKVVTLSNTNWQLKIGSIVGVKFTNSNTASSVTLNVNGTGDISIYYDTSVYTSTSTSICGTANRVIYYMYDGTNWVWMNIDRLDGNTDTKVTQTVTTTSANYEVLFSATADNTTRTEAARKNNNLLFNPSTGNLQATQLNGVTIGANPKFTDNDTTYANVSTSAAGLAPKVTDTSKYLKGDGTWATPTNTTYSNVSTAAAGLAPKVTNTGNFLKGDGTWAVPTNTTYSNVSTTAAGLAPKVTSTSKFLKGDGTWATPTNTTYSNATTAAAGLMSKDDKVKLNGITAQAAVKSIATGTSNGTINVNINGTTSNVPVAGLGSAAYTNSTAYAASGHNHDNTYLKLSGGTMTGGLALSTALNDSRFNSSNQQVLNVDGGDNTTRTLYVGNPTNCSDIIFETKNGTVTTANIRDTINWTSGVNTILSNEGLLGELCRQINDSFTFGNLIGETRPVFFSNWTDNTNFPSIYGSGLYFPCTDNRCSVLIYGGPLNGKIWYRLIASGSSIDTGWVEIATQANFQAGVNAVYNAVSAKGVTPASTSLSDVINAINNIPTGGGITLQYKSKTITLSSSNIQPWTDGWYYGSTSVTFDFPNAVLGIASIDGINFYSTGYAGPTGLSGNTVNIGFTISSSSGRNVTINAYGY